MTAVLAFPTQFCYNSKIMKTLSSLLCAGSLFLTGCWTLSETEYPSVAVKPGRGERIRLADFKTGIYSYHFVEGHESMSGTEPDAKMVDQEMVAQDASWMMSDTASGRLVARTVAELGRKGYKVSKQDPNYVIELGFSGPVLPEDDFLLQLGYIFGTLFTAEKSVVTWTAHLKVRDGATNAVLYERDIDQTYELTVWGPIPVASPGCCEKIDKGSTNCWVLTALTDRAVADATAFISGRAK